MTFDARDELWNASFDTYYDSYYNEIAIEKLINRWQFLDELTKILVALTASGSAISGWALWNTPDFKKIWLILAGIGAVLAIIHSTLNVPGRLKDLSDNKCWFGVLRVDLETFRYKMSFDPNFSIDDFSKDFVQYRKRYGEGLIRLKNDILWTKRIEKKSQNDLNERLKDKRS